MIGKIRSLLEAYIAYMKNPHGRLNFIDFLDLERIRPFSDEEWKVLSLMLVGMANKNDHNYVVRYAKFMNDFNNLVFRIETERQLHYFRRQMLGSLPEDGISQESQEFRYVTREVVQELLGLAARIHKFFLLDELHHALFETEGIGALKSLCAENPANALAALDIVISELDRDKIKIIADCINKASIDGMPYIKFILSASFSNNTPSTIFEILKILFEVSSRDSLLKQDESGNNLLHLLIGKYYSKPVFLGGVLEMPFMSGVFNALKSQKNNEGLTAFDIYLHCIGDDSQRNDEIVELIEPKCTAGLPWVGHVSHGRLNSNAPSFESAISR